ncbi:MAG: phytoene dehydrogenase [Herminiimonas sp.]|nr:phytoene dehydrogenase [Herminiimonas sp.]
MRPSRRIAIVGGGWAGCAAAVELTRQGHAVTLYEASRALGGRARHIEANGKTLDNGQHILLGAYRDTLRLMRLVGIDLDRAMLRLPLQMRYPPHSGGMDFVAPRLPAPLHLLGALWRASGLEKDDKLALARFSSTARWMGWRLHTDCTVSELLDRFNQTDRVIRLMWRPLCIAALNTVPEHASAQVFLNVLRDSLGARRSASDMLIPRVDLSALFPIRAAAFIEQRNGSVRYGAKVEKILAQRGGWRIAHDPQSEPESFDAVVIATSPWQAARLLEGLQHTVQFPAFTYEPITTCYLQYGSELTLAQPLFALADDADANEWGQFVFDRGQLNAGDAGMLAVVVSASHAAISLGNETLTQAIIAQLVRVFQMPALASPQWTRVISEKRATFSCTPSLLRPDNETGIDGLAIAGDYTSGDYPATLEGAVRSGLNAARLLR